MTQPTSPVLRLPMTLRVEDTRVTPAHRRNGQDARHAARNGNPSKLASRETGRAGVQITMNPGWQEYVYSATDVLFEDTLGPEISDSARDNCPVFGGQHSTATPASIAAAGDDNEPGSLLESIHYFLWEHTLIVMATGSGERSYAAYVELGHRIVAWGYDTGREKEPQPFLRPALYQVREPG